MFSQAHLVNELIANQHRAMRFYLYFAVGLAAFGAALICLALLSSARLIPETFKSLLAIGGGFVSSLSAFPVKEILNRKEKVGMFELIQGSLSAREQARDSTDPDERRRIENLVWQAVERILLG